MKRSQKSPESPLFRLDPFSLNVLHTPKSNIGTWSEFVKREGGVGCGVEFYDCVKRGLNGAGVWCDHLNPLFNHRLCEPGQESLLEG